MAATVQSNISQNLAAVFKVSKNKTATCLAMSVILKCGSSITSR